MNEDFAHRAWIEHHGEMSRGIDRAIRGLGAAMKVLHEKQFSAPWRVPQACDAKSPC